MTLSDQSSTIRVCECCEAEGGEEFVVDQRGDSYCPKCAASLHAEMERMIEALPGRIGLCPQCAPEFYYPLKEGEGLRCPTPECGLEMVVYERARNAVA